MPRRVLTTLAAASVALAVLAGCTPTEPEPTAAPTTEPTPSATPSSEPTDQPVGTPVGKTCDQLVSPDTLYVYNPNFGPVDDFTPTAGTPAASAAALAAALSPMVRIVSAEGPMKTRPAASTASAKPAFSERKP